MRNKCGGGWILLGIVLLLASGGLTAFNLLDANRAAQTARQAVAQLEAAPQEMPQPTAQTDAEKSMDSEVLPETEIPDYQLNPEMEMPVRTVDGREYIGVLRIPALNLELPVQRAWSYPNLRVSPCRYQGSAYDGTLIVAGHNYPSHFGNLKQLHQGDAVSFEDADGNRFDYEVAEIEILSPEAVEEMAEGDWDLTLFTCTLGGGSRVTVRCVLTESV